MLARGLLFLSILNLMFDSDTKNNKLLKRAVCEISKAVVSTEHLEYLGVVFIIYLASCYL